LIFLFGSNENKFFIGWTFASEITSFEAISTSIRDVMNILRQIWAVKRGLGEFRNKFLPFMGF